jgi:hypothetical protein
MVGLWSDVNNVKVQDWMFLHDYWFLERAKVQVSHESKSRLQKWMSCKGTNPKLVCSRQAKRLSAYYGLGYGQMLTMQKWRIECSSMIIGFGRGQKFKSPMNPSQGCKNECLAKGQTQKLCAAGRSKYCQHNMVWVMDRCYQCKSEGLNVPPWLLVLGESKSSSLPWIQVKAAKMNVLQRDKPKTCVQQAGLWIVTISMVWVMVRC